MFGQRLCDRNRIRLERGLAVAAAVDGGSTLDTVDPPVAEWVADVRTPLLTDVFNAGSRRGGCPSASTGSGAPSASRAACI